VKRPVVTGRRLTPSKAEQPREDLLAVSIGALNRPRPQIVFADSPANPGPTPSPAVSGPLTLGSWMQPLVQVLA
jgi:hypothetical protein